METSQLDLDSSSCLPTKCSYTKVSLSHKDTNTCFLKVGIKRPTLWLADEPLFHLSNSTLNTMRDITEVWSGWTQISRGGFLRLSKRDVNLSTCVSQTCLWTELSDMLVSNLTRWDSPSLLTTKPHALFVLVSLQVEEGQVWFSLSFWLFLLLSANNGPAMWKRGIELRPCGPVITFVLSWEKPQVRQVFVLSSVYIISQLESVPQLDFMFSAN